MPGNLADRFFSYIYKAKFENHRRIFRQDESVSQKPYKKITNMKNYSAKEIKNIVLIGAPGTGKTTLAEAMAFEGKVIDRRGSIEANNTLSDNTDIEHEYKRSIYSTILFTEFMDRKLNIIDCPGSDDFCGSLFSAFKVGDVGVFLFNAQNGWEVGSEIQARYARLLKKPVIGVVNQLDAEKANFEATIESIRAASRVKPVIVQYPVNQGPEFNAFIDVLLMKMYRFKDNDGHREELEIPAEELEKAQELNKLESEEKELFGFDLSNYTMSKEIQEAESPFLSARSIQHLVEMYLNHRLGGNNYILGDGALKTLRLSAVARSEILSDLRNLTGLRNSLRRKWEVYLKGNNPNHPITFDSEAAEKNRTAFFVTPMHPLVKQAASYFATNKLVYIHLEYYSDEIPAGDYPMSIYAWDYVGIRSNFKLVAICEEPRIAAELPEYILTAAAVDYSSKLKPEVWDALEEHHVQMWQAEKAQHTESTRQVARYKLESLKNNYRNRKLVLERKIAEAGDERIATMHRSELENATQRYQQKVSEIEAKIAKADIHTTLIANGVITVK